VDDVNLHFQAGDRIVTSDMLWYLSYVYYNRTQTQPLLYTPPRTDGSSSRPNDYGFGTLTTPDVYLDHLSDLPKGTGRIWLIGTADVPDEFAPLPTQWHIGRQMTAGGVTARLYLSGNTGQ
jgi:hypothetical protein